MALSFSLFLLFYKKFETYTIRNYLIYTFQIIKHPPPPFAKAPPISQGGMHYSSFQHFCHPEQSRRTSTHSQIHTFSHFVFTTSFCSTHQYQCWQYCDKYLPIKLVQLLLRQLQPPLQKTQILVLPCCLNMMNN